MTSDFIRWLPFIVSFNYSLVYKYFTMSAIVGKTVSFVLEGASTKENSFYCSFIYDKLLFVSIRTHFDPKNDKKNQ